MAVTITLRFRYKSGSEKSFSSSKDDIILGRPLDQHQPIDLDLTPDLQVSRAHAKLFYELSTWWVEDLKSKHGTLRDGQRVAEPTPLAPGDELQLGDTVIRVDFLTAETLSDPVFLEDEVAVSETEPPDPVTEDTRLEILARVSDIAARFRSKEAMLEVFLDVLAEAFPQSDRRTILLIEDRELVVRASWPLHQAFVSFTLARQAIKSQQALHWRRDVSAPGTVQPTSWISQLIAAGLPIGNSLQDTTEALCAPMLSNQQAVGVVNVESQTGQGAFTHTDIHLLSVIANIVGSAIKAGEPASLTRLPSVFVSYSHEDRDFINGLASDLRRRRVKVWFDERLRTGEAWLQQIDLAICSTDALILVMSPSSIASTWVQRELQTALSSNKRIIPLRYRPCEVPAQIKELQYAPVGDDYNKWIDELAERLYELINPGFENPR
ncbi:MAG TPA: TIR domain-containing protein [Blastocatellia bacterium]|nr:TIR domain-containing protein [Blastocatellia bacterium]